MRDPFNWIFGGIIALIVALVVLIVVTTERSETQRCDTLFSQAQTGKDTLLVVLLRESCISRIRPLEAPGSNE